MFASCGARVSSLPGSAPGLNVEPFSRGGTAGRTLHNVARCKCDPAALCDVCFARELRERQPQARVLGAMWAEQVARLPEYRTRESWPMTGKVQEIARRKVQDLSRDERLREEFAQDCIAGAVAWWAENAARRRGPLT